MSADYEDVARWFEQRVIEALEDEFESDGTDEISNATTQFSKEWVKDPSPNAQNTRWRNTETGEYRYQEGKPGSGHSGGGGGGGSVDVSEVDTDYDIDSNFGAEVAQAMEENDGDPVGTIRANEWMSNAGKIDDPDLLLDALEPIQDHGTKTARDRVRRRLRGMGWEPDEIDDALSEGEEQDEEPEGQSPHEEWQEQYESATVEKTMSLGEAGADSGVNAKYMEVEQLEDGTEVYRMSTTPHSSPAGDVRNQQVAYAALRVMDAGVPPQVAGEDGEEVWYAMKETEGETVWAAPNSWRNKVERDDYVEEMAKQLIVGNSDCHGENIAITEEGDIEVFDLDHSTGKLDTDPAHWGQSVGSKALQQFYASAAPAGVDDDGIEDDILDRARELAKEMKESGQVEEIKDAITEVESKGREDKIEYNINLLAEGGDINL